MGYLESMEAAGATVHEFRHFGSYQGEWYAHITYEGDTGWVRGTYGSCSGCDAFQDEFGWREDETPEKLAEFGRTYCETLLPFGHYFLELYIQSQTDSESEKALRWMADMEIKYLQEKQA